MTILGGIFFVVKTFLNAVTADGKPQYPPEIFMKQRAELAQWWADKLEGIVWFGQFVFVF